jgi:opacity protein-like surface antigen
MRRLPFVLALVLVSVAAARAQDPPRVTGTAGGAVVAPLSGTADNFSTGWGLDVGATWRFTGQMGVKFDYIYAGLGGKDAAQGTAPIDASLRLQAGTVAFVFEAPPSAVRLYLMAGGGIYHRSVALTTSAAGSVSVCNPWWFVCHAQPMPASSVAGTNSSTDVGVNVGAGFNTRYVFVEARYHYMTGPSFATPSGTQKATGKFFPLIVGIRFLQAR